MGRDGCRKAAWTHNEKVFASKARLRVRWARRSMEEKIREVVRMQELIVSIRPELKGIIPWRLKG
ncbi:MAG: hypothetical protein HY894_09295 [Deltaproteobacteria bacterium]|nr:hypothetical protein [Deltaproteobacteria bacterium]